MGKVKMFSTSTKRRPAHLPSTKLKPSRDAIFHCLRATSRLNADHHEYLSSAHTNDSRICAPCPSMTSQQPGTATALYTWGWIVHYNRFSLTHEAFLACESLNGWKIPSCPLPILSSGPSLFLWSAFPMVQTNAFLSGYGLSSGFSIASWFRAIVTVLDSCVRWACGVRSLCQLDSQIARGNGSPGRLGMPPPYHSAENTDFPSSFLSQTADNVAVVLPIMFNALQLPRVSLHFDYLLLFSCLGEDWWR